MIIFSFLVVVAVCLALVVAVALFSRNQIVAIERQHHVERLQWAEETGRWDEERRYLVDRVIARHSHDIIAMDKASQPRNEMADTINRYDMEQRLSAHVPEGL